MPASGRAIRVNGMNLYRRRNARVTGIWTQFDGVGMTQRLGATPRLTLGSGDRRMPSSIGIPE